MKWSLYNVFYEHNNKTIVLYNYAIDSVIILVKELKEIIDLYRNEIDKLSIVHPDLYKEFVYKGFIIDDNIDEKEFAIERINKKLDSPEVFKLTINPTLDCNLRCWYCYETLIPNSHMSLDVVEGIKKLLLKIITNQELKSLELSFFGGEPLFKTKERILSIISFAQRHCELNRKILKLHFTTNATLLSHSIIKQLASLKLNTTIQVPFDGGREQHNQIKKFRSLRGSYDIVLKHTINALRHGINVYIRCNYTTENISSFTSLIEEVNRLAGQYKNRISFYMQQVWQTAPNLSMYKKLEEIKSLLVKNGFDNNLEGKDAVSQSCYADFENSLVINYNGDIFKCTARDFKTVNRIGTLHYDGSIVYNENYRKRRLARFNQVCKDCIILPICTICSQKRYEMKDRNACPENISEEDKRNQIVYRLKALYSDYL